MENTGRSVTAPLRSSIKKASQRLRNGIGAPDFWALVRAIESSNPTKPRFGKGKNPQDENIRFGQAPYLNFPATDIAEIVEGGRAAGVDATVILYFFGLLGVDGPMPLEFTNYVFRRSHNHFDNTWRRFLDIIHHRFMTLYYRSYAANQQAMSFDRNGASSGCGASGGCDDDPLSFIIKSLAGFSPASGLPVQNERVQKERLILKSAHQLSFLAKNRRGMEDLLRSLFTFNNIEVRDFIPSFRDIPVQNYAYLGKNNTTIGLNLQIGRTYTSITEKFEIHIGPLSFEEYRGFIFNRGGANLLVEAVSLYLNRPLDYSVVFTVRWDTIPLAQLGFDLKHARWDAPQLGYTCWIGNPEEQLAALTISAARLKRGKKSLSTM